VTYVDVTDGNFDENEETRADTETARQFAEAQQNDKSLSSYWQRAKEGSTEFLIIRNLLHKRKAPGGNAVGNEFALVVPQIYENEILEMAHTHPFGGHLGRNKCKARIDDQFWFPKMKQKIADYIKRCHECQITAGIKLKERAPMQPVHVMNKYPFEDISIDVLGNLPTTARRNKYILTIVCSNSKWIEAKPMANCKADTIADKLLEFFSYSSIPKSFAWTICLASNRKF